jgi:trigger factor
VKKMQAQLSVRSQAVDALVELVAEEIPEPLINEEMQRRLHELSHRLAAQGADLAQYLQATGQDAEEFQAGLREAAISAVKADLALRAVADAEDLDATDEEVDAEIERIAQATDQKPAAVRKQLDRNDQLPAVRSDIRKGKALTWLTEHVEIADEEGKIIDRAELMNPTPDTPAEEEAVAE